MNAPSTNTRAGFPIVPHGAPPKEPEVPRSTNARAGCAANIAAFEGAWYGQHAVSNDDADEFRQRIERIKQALAAPRGAAA
jgi:hypothetical protein